MNTTSRNINKKRKKQKITMLTAYDYPLASLVDQAGIDMILVGDSLANVVLGLKTTRQVGMAEMIHHARAVRRAVKNALLIGDMPYKSYSNKKDAVKNARRFVKEAGCHAVKLEWFNRCPEVARAIIKSGIPVMGHVGLTPQTAKAFKVRGKDAASARKIIFQAKQLEKAGCFSIVLECVPDRVAQMITRSLRIPTIGIGAGPACDGQVLVTYDLLGIFTRYKPKFVKPYARIDRVILKALRCYQREVLTGRFPTKKYSFAIQKEEFKKL